ncbi:MAG TPA: hypothetical protein VFY40_05785 [Blastocatellia bacterium]|nr:hypothetical protein [Blastocatellia bacterium]
MKNDNTKVLRDTRDAKKSEDLEENDSGANGSQQAAELQVGEEDERANPDRFEPDPRGEPPSRSDSSRKGR